jgi:membrane peptidoglycan carboxypeptidase
MSTLRPSPESGFLTRLGLFLGVSVLSGVLVAGLALPVLGSLGLIARNSANGFESLPAELKIPPLPQRSTILTSDGRVLAHFFYENRISVPLTRVAPVMRQSIVAIEDSRFYDHGGIDLRGTLRAFVNNQSGQGTQGGSTLTQQYVKQVLLESAQNLKNPKKRIEAERAATEQSYSRKIRELRYAVALEERYSKAQILQRYLNIAYFGSGAYGIEAASLHYFDKHARALTTPEAALLAGIVQQPTAFDPIRNPGRARARRDIVLDRMAQVGYLTQAEADKAKAKRLHLHVPRSTGNGCDTSKAPFFCNYVLNVVKNDRAFGRTTEDRVQLLLKGGLTITTTLDRRTQRAAQHAVRRHVEPRNKVASAVASVEPGTGKIKAIAINRYFGDGKGQTKQNYAVPAKYEGGNGFQAGSTFKVFVAAAALEMGIPFNYSIYAPYHLTHTTDMKACTGTLTEPWGPFNESPSENGTYTMATGIADSVNTYFAQLEERTGVCRPARIATALGARRADGKPLQQVKSFTLGVNEVAPLSMAEAYATFAARGMHCDAIAITRVTNARGRDLQVPGAHCSQVLDTKIADGMNSLLQGVIKFGTGSALGIGRPAAGKTGTTNSRSNVWFIGYTPQLATAVWAGNPSPPRGGYPLKNRVIGGVFFSTVCGGCLPGPIWQETMIGALQGVPISDFTAPPPSVSKGDAQPVPSVSGMSVQHAKDVLRGAGFSPVVSGTTVYASYAAAGTVAFTSPGGGSSAFRGSPVTIYISKGPPPTPTPAPSKTKGPKPSPTPTATSSCTKPGHHCH